MQISEEEWDRVVGTIRRNFPIAGEDEGYASMCIWMADADLLPVSNITKARWVYTDNYYGCALLHVSDTGETEEVMA